MTICVLHFGPSVPLSSRGLPKYTHLEPTDQRSPRAAQRDSSALAGRYLLALEQAATCSIHSNLRGIT